MVYYRITKHPRYENIPVFKPFNQWLSARDYLNGDFIFLPNRIALQIYANPHTIYYDLLVTPFPLLSQKAWEVYENFHSKVPYKQVVLQSGEHDLAHYRLPFLQKIPCNCNNYSKTAQLMFDTKQIKNQALFLATGSPHPLVIIRLDLVESLLRNGITGFDLSPIVLT